MKRYVLIIMLLCVCFASEAQNDNKKNSISLGFGSVVTTKMESFSPTVDLSYRRDVFKGFGLNVGYKFKGISINCFANDL